MQETEAAVSRSLPKSCPYLFSNRFDQILRKKGLALCERTVQALTRAKVRQIAADTMGRREGEAHSGEPESNESEHPLSA